MFLPMQIIEKVSHLLGLVLVEEEDRAAALTEHTQRKEQVDHLQRKSMAVQVRGHPVCMVCMVGVWGCPCEVVW